MIDYLKDRIKRLEEEVRNTTFILNEDKDILKRLKKDLEKELEKEDEWTNRTNTKRSNKYFR